MIKLNTSFTDMTVIGKVLKRIVKQHLTQGRATIHILMDLELCHQICPLDLNGLLVSNLLDFSHDINGIQYHLDRTNYVLRNGFLPRYARVCQAVNPLTFSAV